jgi:hypothetical protein
MQMLAAILSRYGISSAVTSTIDPHRDDWGQWRVKFSGPGAPSVLMDIGGASRLAAELRHNAEVTLADRLDAVVATTRRYARGRQL